jgi:hypothetical protein
MKIKNVDGSIEMSIKDLAKEVAEGNITLVVDEFTVSELGGIAARRAAAEKNRSAGMSWSKARATAKDAKPTPEMLAVIRASLGRGANNNSAIEAAIKVGRW